VFSRSFEIQFGFGRSREENERKISAMSYYGGYGGDGGGTEEDVFVKTAVEIKRFLPSLFNIKVVRLFVSLSEAKSRQPMSH